MSKVIVVKDSGFGNEGKCHLSIDIPLTGKGDSRVIASVCTNSFDDIWEVQITDNVLSLSIVEKIAKRKCGTEHDFLYEDLFAHLLTKTKLKRAIRDWAQKYKSIGNLDELIYFKLLFCIKCLDACKDKCVTAFPCDIGSRGTLADDARQLEVLSMRTDLADKAIVKKNRKDDHKKAASAISVGAGYTAASAGAVAAGGLGATDLSIAGGVIAAGVAEGSAALSAGASVAGAANVAASSIALGASAMSDIALISMSNCVAAVALPVAAAGLIVLGSTYLLTHCNDTSVHKAEEQLAMYANLVQHGNIGRYCELYELAFHEIWAQLSQVSGMLECADIFDLETQIDALL